MWNVIRKFLYFRMGQTAMRGTARALGFGTLATIAGLFGGYRAMKRNS